MSGVIGAVTAATVGALGVLVGAWLSARWEDRRTRRELALERYREANALLNELMELAGRRHFALQRWLWATDDPDAYEVDATRRQYFDLLSSWNARTWAYRANLRLLLGEDIAHRYLDYVDDVRSQPESLHYMFVTAHQAVLANERGQTNSAAAQAQVDALNHAWSRFADDVAVELLHRARGLRLLELPKENRPQ